MIDSAIYNESTDSIAFLFGGDDREVIKQRIRDVNRAASRLTPAGKKLLLTLHREFERRHYAALDRADIAAALGRRRGLAKWDRALLDKLCRVGFIRRRRVALARRAIVGGGTMPSGAKYVYKMDINIGWRLAFIRARRRAS